MDIITLSAIVLAITSLAGSILAFRKLTLAQNSLKIEYKNSTTNIYDKLVDDLSDELERLGRKVEVLEESDHRRREQVLKLQLELNQARQRISVLEEENEDLRNKTKD